MGSLNWPPAAQLNQPGQINWAKKSSVDASSW